MRHPPDERAAATTREAATTASIVTSATFQGLRHDITYGMNRRYGSQM